MLTTLTASLFLSVASFFNLFGIRPALVTNQIVFLAISIGIFILVRTIGWLFFKNNANLFYWIFIGLLVLTFLIGAEIKGSKRWIDLYFFNFQTSEFLKVLFI